jgi:GR25 family glycosyltransferase involved in LPS biosynthesis
MDPIPFYILHYKGNADRKRHLDDAFAKLPIQPQFITEFDREEFKFEDFYRYDETLFRKTIEPIKDVLIGNVIALFHHKTAPWANCVALHARRNRTLAEDLQDNEWLRPRRLRPGDVSLILKHRVAWQKIAEGDADWAIVAEDDIVFHEHSSRYLLDLPSILPKDFDYIDIAGGCGMLPRMGNPVVNEVFFAIDPPGGRTTCCAIVKRSLARRLIEAVPICIPIDWAIGYVLNLERAKVYWIHPPVFVHGSETNFYKSWQRS